MLYFFVAVLSGSGSVVIRVPCVTPGSVPTRLLPREDLAQQFRLIDLIVCLSVYSFLRFMMTWALAAGSWREEGGGGVVK